MTSTLHTFLLALVGLLGVNSASAQQPKDALPAQYESTRRELLSGIDANGNGVPDAADQYIAEKFGVGTPQGLAATRFLQLLTDNHIIAAAGGWAILERVNMEKAAMSCLLERADVHSDLVNRFARPLVLFVSKPWNDAHIRYAVDVEKKLGEKVKFPKGEEGCAFARVPAASMPGKKDPASAAYSARKAAFQGVDADRNSIRDEVDAAIEKAFGKDSPQSRAVARWAMLNAELGARLVGGGEVPEWLPMASAFSFECLKTRLTTPAESISFDQLVKTAFDTPLRKEGLDTVLLKHKVRDNSDVKPGEEACRMLKV